MKGVLSVFVLLALVLASGCAGPMFEGTIFEAQPKKDPEVARIVTNTQQMSVEFRQLSEQMQVLNRNQELLETRLARLEMQASAAPKSQDEITALRRDVQLIRAERETLKKEITDDLAARIEKIAARQQAEINAARAAPARSASPAAAGRSGSGYDHKVERGQTFPKSRSGTKTWT